MDKNDNTKRDDDKKKPGQADQDPKVKTEGNNKRNSEMMGRYEDSNW